MKIYTKSGDTGETGLFGGERVSKNAPRIGVYGTVDELNAIVGMALVHTSKNPLLKEVTALLSRVQNELFVLGADLATPLDGSLSVERINGTHIQSLELEIDSLEAQMPPLKQFILPGGSVEASWLHIARTVARRAERQMVHFIQENDYNPEALIFLNRLSDWLFVLARFANVKQQIPNPEWAG